MTGRISRSYSIDDLRRLARRRIPRAAFTFSDGVAEDENTLRAKRMVFGRLKFLSRSPVDGDRAYRRDRVRLAAWGHCDRQVCCCFGYCVFAVEGVLIGRPALYGVVAGGEKGAHRALEILSDELIRTMRLCGVSSVDEISSDSLGSGIGSGHDCPFRFESQLPINANH